MDNHAADSRAPTLRSLALLPRMRRLAVRQAHPRHGLHLHTLSALGELQSLGLKGAGVTDGVMSALSGLTALTQVGVCTAGAGQARLPDPHLLGSCSGCMSVSLGLLWAPSACCCVAQPTSQATLDPKPYSR